MPAHGVERVCFRDGMVECVVELPGAGGVAEGLPVIAASFPGQRQYPLRAGLLRGVAVFHGQCERMVQMLDPFFVVLRSVGAQWW